MTSGYRPWSKFNRYTWSVLNRYGHLKDFPSELIDPYGVEIVDPDRFIINQWDLDPIQAIAAFKAMRARWKRPETSPEDFAVAFDRVGLLASAQRLREVAELI